MNYANAFGHEVRELRRALDLTQEELARRVGCAAITIRKIEAGDLRPSQQIAERLAQALAIPLNDRAEFVRQARSIQPGDRAPEPTPTPQITPAEIGQPDLSGRAIRGYLLGEKIGAGSFGAVYRGVQPLVEREVAIKIILPQYANHPDFIRRFEAEARLVARLEHPHIVPLYDYWREPGVAYLVMRLLRGGSLHDLIARGPLSLDQIDRVLDQIGAALVTAHRSGVVHRDLKPSNILLDEDCNAYLADFGIAKNLGSPDAPAYLSPEQTLSETVRPQTDVYALGVMVYEMLTGDTPLSAQRDHLPGALDDVIAHATAKNPDERYAEVDLMVADFKRARGARPLVVRPIDLHHRSVTVNPYKGLRSFEEADAADFFGREALTQQLLARLGESGDLARFLAIVGPSGSGKSSVVKAGLIPALRRGALPHSENWFIVETLPGSHPLEEIEAALLRIAVNPPSSLLPQITADRRGLLRAIQRSLPDDESELVLVLDQFEEVFTLLDDEGERARLLEAIVAAIMAERSRVRVIVTLRADFIDKPLRYVDFGEVLQRRSEWVLPLTPDEIEHVIIDPAQRVGLQVEAGLAEAITADVIDQPGGLPLLQYALTELYEQRQDDVLTKQAYHAIGGVKGALGRRAEEVYAALNDDTQLLAKQIFLRLVTLGEGVEDTRRRVALAELETLTPALSLAASRPAAARTREGRGGATPLAQAGRGVGGEGGISTVLDAFGKARLLSFDRDLQTRGPTVEVAHEALLHEWPRLREWLIDSRADVRLQRALSASASEWLHAERDASFLLRGSRLQQFEDWAKTTTLALTSDEHAYLHASLDERERQQLAEEARRAREVKLEQRAKRVLQGLVAVAVIAALISGALALWASNREQEALRQASIGLAAQALNELQGTSPERAVLLALEALEKYPYTGQAESALARAVDEGKPYFNLTSDYKQSVYSGLAWSPDGKRLAGGNSDKGGKVIVWDIESHREVNRLEAPAGSSRDCGIIDMAWSPTGDFIATVSGYIPWGGLSCPEPAIWSLETHTKTLTITVSISEATSIDWSHDGQYLLTAHMDGTARIWDAQQGVEQRVLTGHLTMVRDAAWSPADDRIVTVSQDRMAKVWDAKTGQPLLTLSGHADSIKAACWSPDGQQVATASDDGTGRVWDATTGEVRYVLAGHTAGLLDIDWLADGKRIATVGQDGMTIIWDAADGSMQYKLRSMTGSFGAQAWSPRTDQLAVSADNEPRVWNLAQRTLRLPNVNTDWAGDARWSPDGKRIATTSWDATARIWDAATGQQLLLIKHQQFVPHFDWSPDSQRIVTGNGDGVSRVWDASTGRLLVEHHGPPGNLYAESENWSPDGSRIVTPLWPSNEITIWDANTGQTLLTFGAGPCNRVKPLWSPHGDRIVAGCNLSTEDNPPVQIWDSRTGQPVMTLPNHDGEIYVAVWSPDGGRMAVAYESGVVKVWDAITSEEQLTFGGHGQSVYEAAWSPDGKRIASGDQTGNVKIWDSHTGQEVMNFTAPGLILILRWSNDGRYVITAGGFTTPFIKRVWQSTDELIHYAKDCCVLRELTAAERQQFGLAAK